jgi:hypothetical protein
MKSLKKMLMIPIKSRGMKIENFVAETPTAGKKSLKVRKSLSNGAVRALWWSLSTVLLVSALSLA